MQFCLRISENLQGQSSPDAYSMSFGEQAHEDDYLGREGTGLAEAQEGARPRSARLPLDSPGLRHAA
jgi:hypothetical protein